MNEIRKNKEEEKILIEGKFKYSFGAVLVFILTLIVSITPLTITLAISLPLFFSGDKEALFFAIPFLFISCIIFFPIFIGALGKFIGIKKNQLFVTNKRIYGRYHIKISRKEFSYRLDEIDNVEMQSTFGFHHLAVQFSQGKGPVAMNTRYPNSIMTMGGFNVFRISYLANEKEVYDILNDLLTDTKNVIDLETDIKMEGIKAENRKADALEHLAKNNKTAVISDADNEESIDYIEELKSLKKLLDKGVITKEEFDQEKKEIFEKKHK